MLRSTVERYKGSIGILWPHVILVSLNIFVLAPVGAWLTWGYFTKRDENNNKARRPGLVIANNVVALVFIALSCSIHTVTLEVFCAVHQNYGSHGTFETLVLVPTINTGLSLFELLR